MNYSDYNLKDFILDEKFQQWILTPDKELDIFWNKCLEQYPYKKSTIEEAKHFILSLDFKPHYPSFEEYLEDWKKLSQKIEVYEQEKTSLSKEHSIKLRSNKLHSRRMSFWVAAVVLGLLATMYILLLKPTQSLQKTVQTKFAQIRKVVLPDQSVVTLNANSSITYQSNWEKGKTREIWLKGEAFFSVKKTADKQKFIVHTDDLEIEVLGTEFNVNTRRQTTRVVLNSGKVQVKSVKDAHQPQMVMKPEEMVTFHQTNQSLEKQTIDTEVYTSWRNGQWVFKLTPLSEIAQILEDNYNYQVSITDTSLNQRKFIGTFPSNNLDILLETLSATLKVEKSDNKIIFSLKDTKPALIKGSE
jgi:transmembrane sensor